MRKTTNTIADRLAWRVVALVVLATSLLMPGSAFGGHLLELRLGGFINATDPDALNEQLTALDLEAGSIAGFNVDVFLNIPLLPIGVGLRYERASQDQSASSGDSFEAIVKDISLLVDWRIINNDLFYIGPLFTLGYPTGELKLSEAGDLKKEDIDPDRVSLAIAAEGGLHFKWFIVGAELGYKSVKLEPPGFFDVVPEINMSGFYGRLMVGVGLF